MSSRERPSTRTTISVLTASPEAGVQPRRWWALAVISLAQPMVLVDATMVNTALPSAQSDLGFSNSNRQWIVTAYALAFGSLLLLGGRIADLAGCRRPFIGTRRSRWGCRANRQWRPSGMTFGAA
jgi:hypothetical protein